MQNFEYVLTKIIRHRFTCPECEGTGTKTNQVRAMKYVYDCPKCEGEGHVFNFIRTEISLQDALSELQLIK